MFDTSSIEVRIADSSQNAKRPPTKRLESRILFEGAREVRIDHDGQQYRLRQTRNGKLILTK